MLAALQVPHDAKTITKVCLPHRFRPLVYFSAVPKAALSCRPMQRQELTVSTCDRKGCQVAFPRQKGAVSDRERSKTTGLCSSQAVQARLRHMT